MIVKIRTSPTSGEAALSSQTLRLRLVPVAYSPALWLLMSFAFIAIATTRCGDAVR
jgi:hypothetical protein